MDTLYSRMKPFLGNEEQLIERMAGHLDLWEECVRMFPKEEIIHAMNCALECANYEELYRQVHRLKGNLANFGFDAASEKAVKVLRLIKENQVTQIQEAYPELRETYSAIIERIGDGI